MTKSTTPIKRVVIAQCTKAKRNPDWGETVEARLLYDESDYFKKQRAYAEAADAWFIQSAKHGLVQPDDQIGYYNQHAKNLDDIPGWVREQADELETLLPADATIEVLGGKPYNRLADELRARGYEVHEPLDGQKWGPRQRSLKQMVNQSLEAFA